MKKNWRSVNLVAVTLAVALVSGSEGYHQKPTPKCPRTDPIDRTIHLPHEWDCTKFYKCAHGTPVLFQCPLMDHDGNRLYFNPVLEVCDWPVHAGCIQGPQPTTEGPTAASRSSTESIRSTSESSITPTDKTTAVTSNDVNHPSSSSSPSVTNPPCGLPCGDINDGWLISHECSCDKFYQCSNGDLIRRQCPEGLHFNANILSCDYPESAGCEISTPGPTSIAPTTSTIPSECPAGNTGHTVQIPHPTNCSLFYKCDNGEKQLMECPAGLHFNPTIQMCDYPQAAGCTATSETTESTLGTSTTWVPPTEAGPTSTVPSSPSTTTIGSTSTSTESSGSSTTARMPSSSPSSTWITETTESSSTTRRSTERPSTSQSSTRTPGTTEASSTTGRSTETGSTSQSTSRKPETTESSSTTRRSTEAPSTSQSSTRTPGTTEASSTTGKSTETGSTSQSTSRKPETTESSSTTRRSTEAPSTSQSSTRTPGTTEASSTTGRSTETGSTSQSTSRKPETTESSSTTRRSTEAPSTSQSSTRTPGTTEASSTTGRSTETGSTSHSTSRKPETTESSSTTRRSTEAASTSQSSTRTPGTTEASSTSGRSTETGSTSESTSRNPESTESSSTTRKSTGTASTSKPTSARTTTAKWTTGSAESTDSTPAYPDPDCPPDMDGHQIPHETNCSLYYECDEGQKILKECTQGLHFSSDLELCVWPANAGCESTTISPESTSPASDEDSTGEWHTSPSGTSSGSEEVTDSTIDPGTGSCIGTCPKKDPQDYTVMLPHKDCTKFCKCSNTKPYVYDCPTGLHFNPTKMICDYPKSAKCEGKGGYGQPANDD